MALDNSEGNYSAEIGNNEIYQPTVKSAVNSARKKVSFTVKGALLGFQPVILAKYGITGVECTDLGNDLSIISANTTRKKLYAALINQRGVEVIEDYKEATEQVA